MDKTDIELVSKNVERLKPLIRVTKIVCTRSVKGPRGDSYVGFSAAWDTIQDDAGGGADLITAQDGDTREAAANGLTLRDSRFAALMLGMQVDLAGHAQAVAGGNMPEHEYHDAAKAIRANYTKMMADLLRTPTSNKDK